MHSTPRARSAVAGPLGPYAAGLELELVRLGYTPAGIKRKFEVVRHLSRWLGERGMIAGEIEAAAIADFTAERRAAGYRCQLTGRSLTWMLDYLRGIGAVRPVPPAAAPMTVTGQLLDRFGLFLTAERGLAAKTCRSHLNSACRFLAACQITGESGASVGSLTAAQVTSWLAGMARIQAPGTTQNTASMLRTFLTWLYSEGLVTAPLATAVPGAYRRKRVRMPAALTAGEAAALLEGCDRGTAAGLRDYAIVLMLKRLGLRAGEVAALTMEDVDWRAGTVVIAGKGGRRDQLPLPVDVAEAIISYLRSARPAAARDRRLFVRGVAPCDGLSVHGVRHAVDRAARRARLGRVSPHQLRYFAATAMQAAGAPLAEIGQVLRHEDDLTTSVYAKVDVAALRPLARPWPASGQCPGGAA